MNKYEIVVFNYYQSIDSEEKFYKVLLNFFITKYKQHFIKTVRIFNNLKQFLYKKYPKLKGHKFAELCYWFIYDLHDFPKCDNKACTKHIKHFRSFSVGYKRNKQTYGNYCSSSCSIIGTKNKRYNTCKHIYGVVNPNQFTSKNILYRKYKQINVYKKFLNEEAIPLFSLDEYLSKNIQTNNSSELLWKCTKCNSIFTAKIKFCNNRINNQVHHARCPKCYPLYNFGGKSTSIREKEFLSYIKSIYFRKIIENDRTLLKPDKKYNNWKLNHELDIVLPDIKLAFEFNGSYWHDPIKFPETVADDKEKNSTMQFIGLYINLDTRR